MENGEGNKQETTLQNEQEVNNDKPGKTQDKGDDGQNTRQSEHVVDVLEDKEDNKEVYENSFIVGLLTFLSMVLIVLTFPVSVWCCIKVLWISLKPTESLSCVFWIYCLELPN